MRLKVAGLIVVGLIILYCFHYLITLDQFWDRNDGKITELPTPKFSEMTITLPSCGKIRIFDCDVQNAIVLLLRKSTLKGKHDNQRLFPKLQYIGVDESLNIISIAYSENIIYRGEVYLSTEFFQLVSNILTRVCAQYSIKTNIEEENIFFVKLKGEIVVDKAQEFNFTEQFVVDGVPVEINTKFSYKDR